MDTPFFLAFTRQVLIAASIIISTFLVTSTLKQIKFGQGTIYVKGCAEKEIQSDFVKWQGVLTTTASTQLQAYEKLEKDLEQLHQYLQNQGIDLNKVEFSPINTSLIYQRNDQGHTLNKIEAYELSQSFSIASSDISLVSKVSQSITTLIKNGLSITSFAPQYFYLKIDELKINMLGEAAKDARLRAEELVSKNGARVGVLRSAQQGVFQITPAFSASVSDYGEFDTSSIGKRIKAVVTMEYAID
jgi:hypothetical protein